MIRQNIDVM